jgi:hypothetical protein
VASHSVVEAVVAGGGQGRRQWWQFLEQTGGISPRNGNMLPTGTVRKALMNVAPTEKSCVAELIFWHLSMERTCSTPGSSIMVYT